MRFGFTKSGFAAVDDERRLAGFAFRSSPHWEQAKKEPEVVAKLMLDKATHTHGIAIKVEEDHYVEVCKELENPPECYIRAREKGKKLFRFLTPKLELTRLKIHTARLPKERAEKEAASYRAQDPEWEFEVVEIGS